MTQPFSTVNVLGFDFIKATQQEFVEQLKKDKLKVEAIFQSDER